MLFPLHQTDNGYGVSPPGLMEMPPSSLGLLEKDIEHWLAAHPWILLPSEELLVIAQSVSGQAMADVLALDSSGRLVVIEIKRDYSNRETVGQLLGYAASLHHNPYEQLQALARQYGKDPQINLYDRFQEVFGDQALLKDDLGRRQRLIIVAPEADKTLQSIVEWLGSYGVPIQFVPFSIYADAASGTPRFLQIDGVTEEPASSKKLATGDQSWAGHWIFNTNEKYSPGAWKKMFPRNVAAIYGYPNGPRNLEGSHAGDRVLAYVSAQGLRAVGVAVDGTVVEGTGIFLGPDGEQLPGEYHLAVQWEAIVLEAEAITAAQAEGMGYGLPVRSVFARLLNGEKATVLEQQLRYRSEPEAV